MTRVLGLTGNIAAGKSSVVQLFAEWGATVIDADRLVHELQRPGEAVLRAMVERFGTAILRADGTLDRAAMRRVMLDDDAARRDLEAIVHPAVAERRRALVDAARERGDAAVVVDVPLLFEVDDPGEYDAVILVDAPVAVRRERLITLRGMDPAEADALIAAQQPSALKRHAADVVIDNDGDLATLTERARAAWREVTGE